MINETFIKELSEKCKANRQEQGERVSNIDDLAYYIYLGLQSQQRRKAKQESETDDELFRLAESKAVEATTPPLSGLRVCNKCHTPKECVIKFDGKTMLVNCMCECDIEAESNWQKYIKERDRKQRQSEFLRQNTKNGDFGACTFDNDVFQNSPLAKFAKRYCNEVLTGTETGMSGVLLYGAPGTGKTFTAACIVNELIKNGLLGCMMSVHDMLNAMWEGNKEEFLERLKRFDVVLIDDLGAEHQSKSGFETDQLSAVIDAIDRAGKRLIVTTNLRLEDFTSPKTLQEARVYDRLLMMCQLHVKAEGESRRRKEVRENFSKYDTKVKEWMQ